MIVEFPSRRLIITKTTLDYKPAINPIKYPDFAIFTYNTKYDKDLFKDAKPYDLTEPDLLDVIRIFERCNTGNGYLKISNYRTQCIAVINKNGEKEVWMNCFCKRVEDLIDLRNQVVDVADGGSCFMQMKVNLTSGRCYDVRFNGEA